MYSPLILLGVRWKNGIRGFKVHSLTHSLIYLLTYLLTHLLGDDIKNRLGELNYFQEKVKIAEKKVISDPAYTNILNYFQMMSELRSKENSSREYFIAELEQVLTHLLTHLLNYWLTYSLRLVVGWVVKHTRSRWRKTSSASVKSWVWILLMIWIIS